MIFAIQNDRNGFLLVTEPGVLVIRDAIEPPYIVKNLTGADLEYRVSVRFILKNPDFLLNNPDFLLKNVDFIIKQPSMRPWWSPLGSNSEEEIWHALQTDDQGVIDRQGCVDERKVGGVKL